MVWNFAKAVGQASLICYCLDSPVVFCETGENIYFRVKGHTRPRTCSLGTSCYAPTLLYRSYNLICDAFLPYLDSNWGVVQSQVFRVQSGPRCLLAKIFFSPLDITFADLFLHVSEEDHRGSDQSTIDKVCMDL